MLAIIKKEMGAYFNSMTGYIFLGFLILISAVYFALVNVLQLNPDYSSVLSGTSIMFLILIPTLTMRLFAEEAKQKTDQLLFTAPISINAVVIGKYLAALLLFLIGMAVTILFPIALSQFGELPTAKIMGAYIGFILLGACFISVGMFISVLTDNQIIAAVATFAVLFLLFIMTSIVPNLPADRTSSRIFVFAVILLLGALGYDTTKKIFVGVVTVIIQLAVTVGFFLTNGIIFDGIMVKVFEWFSVLARFENFNKGVLNVADVVYYITFSMVFIYLTINVIEKRRWR